jgi:hypothetical protein
MKVRLIALAAITMMSTVALVGCSTEARAERKGKAAGVEICKAKNADSANEAERHLRKANDKLDDLARFTGRDVREDVRDLDRNLDQMARGNATQQDVNAIVRSVDEARASLSSNQQAAYDGLLEALASCD